MKITRKISSAHPEKCSMIVKGFFGNIKGRVFYGNECDFFPSKFDCKLKDPEARNGYLVHPSHKGAIGFCTDFDMACNMLLEELKIVKTVCV